MIIVVVTLFKNPVVTAILLSIHDVYEEPNLLCFFSTVSLIRSILVYILGAGSRNSSLDQHLQSFFSPSGSMYTLPQNSNLELV